MTNKNNFIVNFRYFVAVLFLLTAIVGCKDDAWEDHYEQFDARLESTLLTVLSEDPEFSKFVALLKQTGYYTLLEASQSFTVWAPNNAALAEVSLDILNNPDVLKEFIGNHISRFSYNTSFTESAVFVKMFNNKYIEFSNTGGTVSFGGVPVVEKDVLTANGILHKVANVLNVKPNIWGYLNDNIAQFPILTTYLNQFNATVFDQANSVRTGTNSLGQAVYDSVFKTSNAHFKIIGDLSSEEDRFTFIGLTDDVYANVYNIFKDYYQYPVQDTIQSNTDKTIFKNLNFPIVNLADLNSSAITTTTGNDVIINSNTVVEDVSLSNGNLFVVNQLNYNAKDIIYKPVRYEIENAERRTIGALSDFTVQKKYNAFASGQFTNVVSLTENPDGNDGNNYFEIAFSNVLSASYTLNLKFTPVGASQDTKLKFEFSYVDASNNKVIHEIPPIVVSNLEDGIVRIGDTYTIPVFINEQINNVYSVKLKVIVDVSEPELLLYDRKFGIDYAELIPIE